MNIDAKTQIELEAAVFRRLVEHLRQRTDVQNIDLMTLAGFCRNCLSNWYEDATRDRGIGVVNEATRSNRHAFSIRDMRHKECLAPRQVIGEQATTLSVHGPSLALQQLANG